MQKRLSVRDVVAIKLALRDYAKALRRSIATMQKDPAAIRAAADYTDSLADMFDDYPVVTVEPDRGEQV